MCSCRRNFVHFTVFLVIMCVHRPCYSFFVGLPICSRAGLRLHRISSSRMLLEGDKHGTFVKHVSVPLKNVVRRKCFQNCKYREDDHDRDLLPSFNMGGSGGGGTNRRFRKRDESGDDSDESDDDATEREVSVLLKKLGLTTADIGRKWGEEAYSLSQEKLLRFLKSYSNIFNRKLIDSWPAWRDKMLADPNFVYKLVIEQTVGLGLVMSGTIAARGKDLLKELDFFLTDCTVGLALNFILTWLLAPTVRASTASSPLMAKLALLPANIFAEGSYSFKQRIGAGVYKGVLFGLCGFMGSVGGTSLAYLLFLVRRITNPSSAKDGKELPNVLANSLGWASFMFVSTNPRYQLVNGFEQVMYKVVPGRIGRAGSLLLRTVNNLAGGTTWVMWARFLGLQRTPPE